jgi:hypothetical protein
MMAYHGKIMLVGLILSLLPLYGCASVVGGLLNRNLYGLIYTRIRVPYTINLDNTPVGAKAGEGRIVQINEPFTGYSAYTRFDSNAIGDIAIKKGFKKVYFADVEIFSILGIWKHEKLYLYGE